MAKFNGLRQPCQTPFTRMTKSTKQPFTLTGDFGFLYKTLTQSTIIGWNPKDASVLHTHTHISQFTVSNTEFFILFLALVVILSVLLILLAPFLPVMKPDWSGFINFVIMGYILIYYQNTGQQFLIITQQANGSVPFTARQVFACSVDDWYDGLWPWI